MGLAGNAAFIVAPRSVTRGIDLERRTFLHSYEAEVDTDGSALETILTAPLVVAQWINCQYYFSTVAPQVFGAGSKTIHNVVGTVGGDLRHSGDLQLGLPWQSVSDGRRLLHEPQRLLAVVQAPPIGSTRSWRATRFCNSCSATTDRARGPFRSRVSRGSAGPGPAGARGMKTQPMTAFSTRRWFHDRTSSDQDDQDRGRRLGGDAPAVRDLIQSVGATGFTSLSGVSGLGHSGYHQAGCLFNQQATLELIITVVPEEKADALMAGLRPLLDASSGVMFVTETFVSRPDYFS